MKLNVTISASPFDEYYKMACLYCYDEVKDYCFSLSRPPEKEKIEIMVKDQILRQVNDLSIELFKDKVEVNLENELAGCLDNVTHYTLRFRITENEFDNLTETLNAIFMGKKGFCNRAF